MKKFTSAKRRILMYASIVSFFMIVLIVQSSAEIPNTISYQGILLDEYGDPVSETTCNLLFKIYNVPEDGTDLWDEDHVGVELDSGRFDVILGETDNLGALPFNEPYWLGITVNGGTELSRIEFTSSAYSLNARSIVDNAVTSAKIQDGAIRFADIGQNGAGTNQIMKWNGSTWAVAQDDTAGGGVTDHGDLAGLGDNDHPQYLHKDYPDSTQTIWGNLIFGNTVQDNYVQIDVTDANSNLLFLQNDIWNSSATKKGLLIEVEQMGTGGLYGIDLDTYHSNSTRGGIIWGIRSHAESNASNTEVRAVQGYANYAGGNAIGVYGRANHGGNQSIGIYGNAVNGGNYTWAGKFDGDVDVNGDIYKDGGGFKIDHPLDPSNKYLQHSFVESPERMNIYNGNTTLDGNGQATIELPEYFETLNKDFCYQLTCIGGYASVFISDEVSGNRFSIAGGDPYMKVSWQITGVRKDKWAEAKPLQVEVEKNNYEKGFYRHPELYGFGIERHVDHDILMDKENE